MYFETQTAGRVQFTKRYQQRPSGGTRVRLPSDRMSQKQWKERCGEIMTYQLNAPMSWEEFKQMPLDIQKQYIEGLQSRFGVNASSLSQMFGVLPLTVRRHIAAKDLGVVFPVGKSMSMEQRALWDAFIGPQEEVPEKEQSTDTESDEEPELAILPDSVETKQVCGMRMKSVRLVFDGELDVAGIVNSLRMILGKNPVGQIEISCELL